MDQWKGENPFYLMIRHPQLSDGKIVNTIVDLDEEGWKDRNAEIIGLPGKWFIVNKVDGVTPIGILVKDGEKPFYRAKHVGVGAGTIDNTVTAEVIAYGLGKEFPDGHEQILWHFYPANMTVTNDDVNAIGIEVLKISYALKLVERRAREIAAEKAAALDSTKPTTPPSGDVHTE